MRAAGTGESIGFRKRWRWLRLTGWGVFLLWFGWYAYVRITTPPAALSDAGGVDGASRDALETELDEIIRALPPPPAMPATASAPTMRGWGWWTPAVLAEGLTGAWDPQNNAVQQVAVVYVTGSAASPLDQIVRLFEEERRPGEAVLPSNAPGSAWGPAGWGDDEALAVGALTFRARYHAAQQADRTAALRDLRVALLLAERGRSADLTGLVQHELGCVAQEIATPPVEATRMIAFLREERMLSVTAGLERTLRTGAGLDEMLDQYYTRDEDGDGWLVLSAATDLQSPLMFGHMTPRSRVWNLLSPLFHGRATMRRKLTELEEDIRVLDTLSYDEGLTRLFGRQKPARTMDVLDGPLSGLTGVIQRGTFQVAFAHAMRARATAVMLALSAYRQEHGDYPAVLEQLVPRFLDDVPLDILTQTPFVYERMSESAYELRPARVVPEELSSFWWLGPLNYQPNSYLPTREAPKEP
jgi:hypothetical protein